MGQEARRREWRTRSATAPLRRRTPRSSTVSTTVARMSTPWSRPPPAESSLEVDRRSRGRGGAWWRRADGSGREGARDWKRRKGAALDIFVSVRSRFSHVHRRPRKKDGDAKKESSLSQRIGPGCT